MHSCYNYFNVNNYKLTHEFLVFLFINHVVFIFEGHLDDETLHYMSMPRCGVRDKVGFATDSRSKRYALQGKYKI